MSKRKIMSECPFCDYQGPSPILAQNKNVIVFEPLNPVTPGHVLVVPTAHFKHAGENPGATMLIMGAAAQYINDAGVGECNIITSIGPNATQTINHLHIHIVPRRLNDGLKLPWSA
jgi:histidine triad (HIT) family protein